jgi:hypothetical protein
MPKNLKTVIFSHDARATIVDLYGGAELADMACFGFEFILARSPESGVHIADDIWMIAMEGNGVWKTAVAYYTFDSDTVTVLDVVKI